MNTLLIAEIEKCCLICGFLLLVELGAGIFENLRTNSVCPQRTRLYISSHRVWSMLVDDHSFPVYVDQHSEY